MSHAWSNSARRIAATAASSWATSPGLTPPGASPSSPLVQVTTIVRMPSSAYMRQHAPGARRLVVRVGVHGHQREGRRHASSLPGASTVGFARCVTGVEAPGLLRGTSAVLACARRPASGGCVRTGARLGPLPRCRLGGRSSCRRTASWRSAWPPTSSPMPSSPASTSAAWRTSALRTRCLGGRKTAGRRAPVRRGHLPGRGRRPWPPSTARFLRNPASRRSCSIFFAPIEISS